MLFLVVVQHMLVYQHPCSPTYPGIQAPENIDRGCIPPVVQDVPQEKHGDITLWLQTSEKVASLEFYLLQRKWCLRNDRGKVLYYITEMQIGFAAARAMAPWAPPTSTNREPGASSFSIGR